MTNRVGVELVWVPPGNFMMGSDKGAADQKPVHRVTFTEGFYMGKYEVTQAQWQKVMDENPSGFRGDNLPVEQFSRAAASEFFNRLNAMNDGYTYRLPTEAEWEYACRARTNADDAANLDTKAWYAANSGAQTHPVGRTQPNAFGLYDMLGNVWEMCQDDCHEDYTGAPADGLAWLGGGEDAKKVLRGCSWRDDISFCRVAYRLCILPSSLAVLNAFGLRVVAIARK